MNALTFQIRTLEPLLMTQLGAGEENSATSFDFVPGSALRGAVIGLYLQQHSMRDAAQDPMCRRLFFDGDVRYLNAYPVNRLGERTLPKPLSWRVNKDERDNPSATIYDFAIELSEVVDDPTSPRGAFCWQSEDQVEFVTPARYVDVHNASKNRNVKRKGDSTVFRYEAIATGETFEATILAHDEDALNTLRPLLEGTELNIGGSRSAGHGRVHIENVQVVENWQEYEQDQEPADEIVVLTLLSDAILCDECGQFTTDLDRVLGQKHLHAFQSVRIVGGFNRKWGLPLIQAPALRAGSVYVYPASALDKQVRQRLIEEGIGERRTEGFGRIAVNWHTQATRRRRKKPESPTNQIPSLTEASRKLALSMAERRLRAVLDKRLLEALSQLRITSTSTSSNAQLSRLRLIVRRAWQESNPKLIPEHLDNLKKDARAQLRRARVGSKSLESWLREATEQDKAWQGYLQPSEYPSIAGITAEATDTIKIEYTMRLLDALLQRTSKEKQQSTGGTA